MINKENILTILDEEFNKDIIYHDEFKNRVASSIEWWNKNLIIDSAASEETNSFVSSKLNIKGVKCLCTSVNIKGIPYYICEFTFRPLQVNQDLGSGNGNAHTISF